MLEHYHKLFEKAFELETHTKVCLTVLKGGDPKLYGTHPYPKTVKQAVTYVTNSISNINQYLEEIEMICTVNKMLKEPSEADVEAGQLMALTDCIDTLTNRFLQLQRIVDDEIKKE